MRKTMRFYTPFKKIPLKLNFTKRLFIIILGLSILPTTSSAMNNNTYLKDSDTLCANTQQSLTTYGHTLLRQILSDEGLDIKNDSIYENFMGCFSPSEYNDSLYNKSSWLLPSTLIRGMFASTDDGYIKTRKNQLSSIITLSWALTDLSYQQNDGFERGSFTILDPHHRLYRFLLDYVKLTTGYDNPESLPFVTTISNFAYRREPTLYGSSHHVQSCPESQFGIDARFEPQEGIRKLFPFENTHLLFGKLNLGNQSEPLLFFKLEQIGLGSIAAMGEHLCHFATSHSNVQSEARREKDLHKDLLPSLETFKKEINCQLEKFPLWKLYREAQNIVKNTKQAHQEYMDYQSLANDPQLLNMSLTGLETIISLLNSDDQDNANHTDHLSYENAFAFIKGVNQLYPNGNNHVRVGNEVILDLR